MTPLRSQLEQWLGWIVLALLLGGCLFVMLPFVSALLWGTVLSVSSWPLYQRLLKLLRGRNNLAAALLAFAMICIILLPLVIVGTTLGENVQELSTAARHWIDQGPPPPPEWLARVPGVGRQATEYWQSFATDTTKLLELGKRFLEAFSGRLLTGGLAL